MSQRKAKEYRQAMEQYRGAVEDVDDLKRRIGAMEARHRREDQREEIRRRQARREAEQWEKKRKKSMEQARRIRAEERRRQLARRQIAVLIAGQQIGSGRVDTKVSGRLSTGGDSLNKGKPSICIDTITYNAVVSTVRCVYKCSIRCQMQIRTDIISGKIIRQSADTVLFNHFSIMVEKVSYLRGQFIN